MLVVRRMALHLVIVLVMAHDGRHFHGRRQVFDDGIEHRLHALVLEGAAAQHGHDLVANRARAQGLLELSFRKGVAIQVAFRHLRVGFGRVFDHVLMPLLCMRP
ncbi:hypothetical protein D3C71_509000 [compost metagenome]